MQLRDKTILLISPEPWDHIFVSKHHYATHLAKLGNRVFFLNPPSSFTLLEKTNFENIYTINYIKFPSGLRFLPNAIQRYFMRKRLSEFQDMCNVKFDIIWSFDNSVFFDFRFLPKNVYSISHIVDYSQNFQFKKAATTAKICFGVSQNIVDRLLISNQNSYLVSHGISLERSVSDITLPGSNKIKATYAGNLNSVYLDRDLLTDLIDLNQDVDFIFLGSGVLPTGEKKNTFCLGKVGAEQLQNYLKESDILLLTYDVSRYPNQLTNSHKMMEYLGSGKMIVCTNTAELENLSREGLFLMAKKNEDFIDLFIKAKTDLAYWNSQKKQQIRRSFAIGNTYQKQIERIEKLIL